MGAANGNLVALTLICLFLVLIVLVLRHKGKLVLTRTPQTRRTKVVVLCLLAVPGMISLVRWLAR